MDHIGFWWEFAGKIGAPVFAATLVACLLSSKLSSFPPLVVRLPFTLTVFYLNIHLDIWEFALILYQNLYPYFNPTGGAHKNGRENRNP